MRFGTKYKFMVILLVFCALCFVIELILFAHTKKYDDLIEYFQPPYNEDILTYDVGKRNESQDNHHIALALQKIIRIHCLFIIRCKHDRLKAPHIEHSWGSRCTRLHIYNAKYWQAEPTIYKELYVNYKDTLDWLLNVHVDSYVIMENLRYMLSGYSPLQPIAFAGMHMAYPYAHVGLKNTTDYLLSRAALEFLLIPGCTSSYIENCLMDHGIHLRPTPEFYSFRQPAILLPFTLRQEFWFWPYIYNRIYNEKNLPTYPVILPYVRANQFYVLDYILYYLRVYGHNVSFPALPTTSKLQADAVHATNSRTQKLQEKIRILCLVMTYPTNYAKVYKPIVQTWGNHCNKLLFFSSHEQAKAHNTIALNVSEGYLELWSKVKSAFRYAYDQHYKDMDWFFKADDDSYAIMANMRLMLKQYSPEQPIYFGYRFNQFIKQGYMSGGAGYVLSRSALHRLVEYGFPSKHCSDRARGSEDFEMGVCLAYCNVTAGDSRDVKGRHRFFPLKLEMFIIPGALKSTEWLTRFMYYKHIEGISCCSAYAITFHYVLPYQMYLFHYLLYQMRPYGIINDYYSRWDCLNNSNNPYPKKDSKMN